MLLNIQHLELHLHCTPRKTRQDRHLGHFQQLHPELWSQCHSWLMDISAQSCHPTPGAEPSASPHSPFRNPETVSSSICTEIAKVSTLIYFNNGDIFIVSLHHSPQNPTCSTNEEIAACACALLLSMMKKTKLVSLGIVHCSHTQLLLAVIYNIITYLLYSIILY